MAQGDRAPTGRQDHKGDGGRVSAEEVRWLICVYSVFTAFGGDQALIRASTSVIPGQPSVWAPVPVSWR